MIRKLILTTVLMLSVFTLVSCGSKTKTSDLDSTSSSTSSSPSDNDKSSTDTESSKENKTETEAESKSETESKPQSNAKDAENKIKLSIYSIDENSLEPNEVSSISLDENLSLTDKLTQLSNAVSKTNFDGLTLQVKSIDTIDGKKVATINLVDSGDKTWVQKFQGSTGGQVTANTLIENYLQSNNKSNADWIDGVKFLYNNETIEYDHVYELSEIHYK